MSEIRDRLQHGAYQTGREWEEAVHGLLFAWETVWRGDPVAHCIAATARSYIDQSTKIDLLERLLDTGSEIEAVTE